jgi:transmembrane protein TMEM260 (protein O-mannosyltransferase)
MISPTKSWFTYIPPIFLSVSLLSVYLLTIAPGLTWANGGSDGGDLITAAATGGVPHPTGYPLYLLVARCFQFLPIGSLAFRTNLMSAMATALAATLVYVSVVRALWSSGVLRPWLAGLAAGYAFGLAPLIWSQAVITEVYALQACLVALIFDLYTQPVLEFTSDQKRRDCWYGLVLGLALGNHVTILLLVPAAVLVRSFRRRYNLTGILQTQRDWFRNGRFDGYSISRQLAGIGVGLLIYLTIPLRALLQPPINWGNPVTLGRLWWLVSGQLYQSYYLQISLPELYERIQAWAGLLLQQYGLLGVALGLLGLVMFRMPMRLYVLTLWLAAISVAFALFYGSVDSYVYLIPMFLSFAIWIGLGIASLVLSVTPRSSILGLGFGLLLIGYFAGRSVAQVRQVDASYDLRAESFGREVLAATPQDAIIFAKGDQAVFALWYFHFALHERPDLMVLATDLLHFDWYQETLHMTYPTLVVPGPFPWPETIVQANPLRTICYVQYSDHAKVDCSKPLASP